MGPIATLAVGAASVGAGVRLAQYFDVNPHRLLAVVLVAGAAVGLALILDPTTDWSTMGWLAVLLCGWTALSLTDAFRQEIPDLISIPFLLLGLVQQAFLNMPLMPSVIAIGLLFGLTVLVGMTAAKWRRGVGGGDVVLLGIALAWLGPFAMVDVLVLAAFFMIPQIAHVVVTGSEDRLPFAPAFGAATLFVWIGGPLF